MRQRRSLRAVCLVAAVVIAACGNDSAPPAPAAALRGADLRVVTLSPHLAELVFAAGAGEMLVGVSAYSDYPDAVGSLPQIGDAFLVDQERLAVLEPDIILAWDSGTPASTVDRLRKRGHRVEVLRTQRLADVAEALRTIGRLTGRQATADAAARRYLVALDQLAQAFEGREAIRIFYQVSSRPVYTVNGTHYVSELIALCGGSNVFDGLDELAPVVGEEAVLARDPEAVIAGGVPGDAAADGAFDEWRRFEDLSATRYGNFFTIDANLLARATTRLVATGQSICEVLDVARVRRGGEAP